MKSSRLLFITTFTALLFVSIACTLPFTISPVETGDEKVVYIEVTSTPVEVATEAPVQAAATSTVSVPINMDGIWTIWQGSNEEQLTVNFLQQGFIITANVATSGGHSLLFEGTINQDNSNATGTWESTNGSSGIFNISFDGTAQSFSGNLGVGVPFCGTRLGSTKPAPCLK